ncbi:MAG: hypothetical protein FJ144_26010 [Deltaproteobacteria bacterium]|nr:hypothetical protein [Deltaproteobacteria bacterium]
MPHAFADQSDRPGYHDDRLERAQRATDVDVGRCYRHGGRVLLDHPVPLLVMGFVVLTLVTAAWSFARIPIVGGPLGFAFGALISTPLLWGFNYVCLQAVRGDGVDPRDGLRVYDRYFETVLAAALTTGLVIVGFLFLVVPGIYLLCRLAFVPYLVVEGRLSAVDAVFESFERTAGYGWTILGILVLRGILLVLGGMTFGLALVPGGVWSDLAMATLYHRAVSANPPPAT